jgi:hypothetical protein
MTYDYPENSNVARKTEVSHNQWNNQIQDSSKVVDIATDPRKSDRVTPTTLASRHDKPNSGSGNSTISGSQDMRTNQTQDSSKIADIANDLQESDRITPTPPASRRDKHKSKSGRHSYVDSSRMATTYDYPEIYEEVVGSQDEWNDQTRSSSTTPYASTAPQKSDSVTQIPPSSLYNEQAPKFGHHSNAKSSKTSSGYDYHKGKSFRHCSSYS